MDGNAISWDGKPEAGARLAILFVVLWEEEIQELV